jgi:hypothetical protein
MQGQAEPFRVVFERLRGERTVEDIGLDVRALARERGIQREGTSVSNLQKQAAGTAPNPPSATLMRLIAEVLGEDPAEFTEYRLWQARQLFDENAHGLAAAAENLERFQAAMRSAARAPGRRAAQRQAASPTPPQADQHEPQTKRPA